MWMTLPRPRPLGPPGAGARPFDVRVGAGTVAGHAWGDGPPVYLLHGWAGSAGQFAAFTGDLTARGHRVVAFDAPSHGRSAAGRHGPRSSSIPEFVDALTAVVAVHGAPHAVIAHSMGAIATTAAAAGGLTASRLVLLAPMASPLSQARQLAGALGLGERTRRRMVARVERRVGARMAGFDMPALGRAAAMPPTLLVHDRDDRYSPFDNTAALAAAWPTATLHATTGLGHVRLLAAPEVVARAVDFVTARTTPDDQVSPP
jgi:pimeloyl-ACP methyl ester carboxylesterase